MIFTKKYQGLFKGPQETVRDNKTSSYPVLELQEVNVDDTVICSVCCNMTQIDNSV